MSLHATSPIGARSSLARDRATDRRAYWLLFWMTFALFLVVVGAARLLPRRLDPLQHNAGPRPSVIAEARSAASATIGYAFMG